MDQTSDVEDLLSIVEGRLVKKRTVNTLKFIHAKLHHIEEEITSLQVTYEQFYL